MTAPAFLMHKSNQMEGKERECFLLGWGGEGIQDALALLFWYDLRVFHLLSISAMLSNYIPFP